jgi:hypothetical protein
VQRSSVDSALAYYTAGPSSNSCSAPQEGLRKKNKTKKPKKSLLRNRKEKEFHGKGPCVFSSATSL